MATAETIKRILKDAMPTEMLGKSGAVLLSGVDTLRPGRAYIMGLNPGGNPRAGGHERSIIDSIADRRQFSCYLSDCWQPACEGPEGHCEHLRDGKVKPQFLVKHQRNAIAIADALSLNITDIFSANAVFARSTSKATLQAQTGYSLEKWWDVCWQVHRHFLAEIRPRLIISLGYGTGSSAFGLLWQQLGKPTWRRFGDNGRRGGWEFEALVPLDDGASIKPRVVGVPHPSYMAIGPELQQALGTL